MSNNKREYDAACIRSMLTGSPLPQFDKIMENFAIAHIGQTLKRSDIIEAIARTMGCAVDESISVAVSLELAELAKKKLVTQGGQHGYWVMCG